MGLILKHPFKLTPSVKCGRFPQLVLKIYKKCQRLLEGKSTPSIHLHVNQWLTAPTPYLYFSIRPFTHGESGPTIR